MNLNYDNVLLSIKIINKVVKASEAAIDANNPDPESNFTVSIEK